MELDAILRGEDGNVEGVESEPAVVEDVAEDIPEESEPEGEKEATPPVAEESKEEPWTKKAVLDERRKRQELEKAKLELEQRLKQIEGKKETPDVFEDQDAYTKHLKSEMQSQMLNMSEFMARREYPDLDEKVARFEQMVKENPTLAQKVMAAPSPYHELVEVVRKAEEMDKMSDIDSYKAKLREEIKAELLAELKSEQPSKGREAAKSVPKSLAGQTSQAAITESVETTLANILGR